MSYNPNHLDLSEYLIDKITAEKHLADTRSEILRKACNEVADLNNKTMEQALIVELGRRLELLTAELDALKAKQSDLEVVQKALILKGFALHTDQTEWLLVDEDDYRIVTEFSSNDDLLAWAKQTIESKE